MRWAATTKHPLAKPCPRRRPEEVGVGSSPLLVAYVVGTGGQTDRAECALTVRTDDLG